jgi:ribosomal protein L28
MSETQTGPKKPEKKKVKDVEKKSKTDKKKSEKPISNTNTGHACDSCSETWRLWIKVREDADEIPVRVDPNISLHELKSIIINCDDLDLPRSRLRPQNLKLFYGGQPLSPKHLIRDELEDDAEIEIRISSSFSRTSLTTRITKDAVTLPVENGAEPNAGKRERTEKAESDESSTIQRPASRQGSFSTIQFDKSNNAIWTKLLTLENAINSRNTSLDLMIRDLRLVLAYLRRAGAGVGENINNLPLLKPKGSMSGHQGPVWTLTHDPKKGILYSGSSDKTIMLWDTQTLKVIDVLHGHDGIVHNLAFSNGVLVSSSDDQTIRVWAPEERKCVNTISVNGYAVSLRVTASNLLAGSHRCIKVWNLEDQTLLRELQGHSHWVRALRTSGGYLYSGSHNEIKMWDLRTFKCVQTMHHNSGSIYALLIENTSIFAATYENTIGIWDMRTFQCLQNLPGHLGAVYSLGISGQRMFSGSYDTTIRVWDLTNNRLECIQRVPAHSQSVEALVVDGDNVFSASTDGTIKLWK